MRVQKYSGDISGYPARITLDAAKVSKLQLFIWDTLKYNGANLE